MTASFSWKPNFMMSPLTVEVDPAGVSIVSKGKTERFAFADLKTIYQVRNNMRGGVAYGLSLVKLDGGEKTLTITSQLQQSGGGDFLAASAAIMRGFAASRPDAGVMTGVAPRRALMVGLLGIVLLAVLVVGLYFNGSFTSGNVAQMVLSYGICLAGAGVIAWSLRPRDLSKATPALQAAEALERLVRRA